MTEVRRICPKTTNELCDIVLLFGEKLTETKLYGYQSVFVRRVTYAILESEGCNISALWSRQAGKTESISFIGVTLAVLLPTLAKAFPDDPRLTSFIRGFLIGIYAPKDEQAHISYTRIRKMATSDHARELMADDDLGVYVVTNRGDRLVFSNGSEVLARTASEQTSIEGATHHLVCLEESQRLSAGKVDKEIRPMLASTNGTMVLIGTAWVSRGGFLDTIQQNIDDYKKTGIRRHYEFPYNIVIAERRRAYEKDGNAYHLNYEKFVNGEIKRLGSIDNPEFKMNFRVMWQENRLRPITQELMDSVAADDIDSDPSFYSRVQVAGMDVGKTNDNTVLTLANVDMNNPIMLKDALPEAQTEDITVYQKTIVDWLELSGHFEGSDGQYEQVVSFLKNTNCAVLVVDATALGDPVAERLAALLAPRILVIPFKFGSISKSNLYRYYVQELKAKRIKYASGHIARSKTEWATFRKEHTDLDQIDMGAYVTYAAIPGCHDDYPDSAAMACYAEKYLDSLNLPTIEMNTAPNPFFGEREGRRRGRRRGR